MRIYKDENFEALKGLADQIERFGKGCSPEIRAMLTEAKKFLLEGKLNNAAKLYKRVSTVFDLKNFANIRTLVMGCLQRLKEFKNRRKSSNIKLNSYLFTRILEAVIEVSSLKKNFYETCLKELDKVTTIGEIDNLQNKFEEFLQRVQNDLRYSESMLNEVQQFLNLSTNQKDLYLTKIGVSEYEKITLQSRINLAMTRLQDSQNYFKLFKSSLNRKIAQMQKKVSHKPDVKLPSEILNKFTEGLEPFLDKVVQQCINTFEGYASDIVSYANKAINAKKRSKTRDSALFQISLTLDRVQNTYKEFINSLVLKNYAKLFLINEIETPKNITAPNEWLQTLEKVVESKKKETQKNLKSIYEEFSRKAEEFLKSSNLV